MHRSRWGLVAALWMLVAVAPARPAPARDWRAAGGSWRAQGRQPVLLWQRAAKGTAAAVLPRVRGTTGCWRCLVEPAPGSGEAGVWFAAGSDRKRGLLLTLGGGPAGGGLFLRDAAGKLLWEDPLAPWVPYTPYLLEGVVEKNRVRVQLLLWDRKQLISQSPWIARPGAGTKPGLLVLHTRDRIARFYRWEYARTPLSPVVANAPNKLRLRHGPDADWAVVGPGRWMWHTPERKVLRQTAAVERTTAIARKLGGAEGTWQCRVRVQPGAGGAGMLFAVDEELQRGFNAWLGGNHGAGGLMLYRLPDQALWSSPQDTWHYDTEYLIEATLKGGKVSIRLLDAAGKELAASPAFDLQPAEVGRPGALAFMTWLGCAEFWGFSAETQADAGEAPATAILGADWRTTGGTWRLDNAGTLEQTGRDPATALHLKTEATQGVWRCRLQPGEGTRSAALLFQADPALNAGFVGILGPEVRLESLEGRVLWRQERFPWQAGTEYVVEGHVLTDRVRLRVLAADGTTLLAESETVYVSDRNNTRRGVLGFRTEGGPVRFRDWSVQ